MNYFSYDIVAEWLVEVLWLIRSVDTVLLITSSAENVKASGNRLNYIFIFDVKR